MIKSRNHIFKRDKRPVMDFTSRACENIMILGDIILPYINEPVVDEVRFYRDQIAFIKDGQLRTYKYKEVKAVISHEIKSRKGDIGQLNVHYTADDGSDYRLNLMCKPNIATSCFTKNSKDLLYRTAKHLPRLKEQRTKPSRFLLNTLLLTVTGLVIVLM